MKKVLFSMVLITMCLVSCSKKNAAKQEPASVDSVAITDSTASTTEKTINEIDSTSAQVDTLVNQL